MQKLSFQSMNQLMMLKRLISDNGPIDNADNVKNLINSLVHPFLCFIHSDFHNILESSADPLLSIMLMVIFDILVHPSTYSQITSPSLY